MSSKVRLCVAASFLVALFLMGCQGASDKQAENNPPSQGGLASPALKPVASALEFEQDLKIYLKALANTDDTGLGKIGQSRQGEVPESLTAQDAVSSVSETNRVEQGVDEADLVKSDGEFLYVVSQGQRSYSYDNVCESELCLTLGVEKYIEKTTPPYIRVMVLNNVVPQASVVSEITVDKVSRVSGIYLVENNNKLLIIGAGIKLQNKTDGFKETTYVAAYDVSDAGSPQLTWQFEVEGYLHASRSLNEKIYLISMNSFRIDGLQLGNVSGAVIEENNRVIDKVDVKDILPRSWYNDEDFVAVDAEDCLSADHFNSQSIFDTRLLSILTIPLSQPEGMQALCTLETSHEIYVSTQAVYFTKGEYNLKQGDGISSYTTAIHKLAFTEDGVAYRASGRISGTTGWRSSAFRMSEKDDYLRVVSTDYIQPWISGGGDGIAIDRVQPEFKHHLFVLTENPEKPGELQQVATLPNSNQSKLIGKPGEHIYAVRYAGDYAYVVTFRNIDPLYAINLKDPSAPFIEGELEVPGYSDYLHPLGDNLLLGVGKDVVESGSVALMQGVKVGLFDISDKSNPQLVADEIFGKRGSDAALSHDYYAFSILSDAATGSHRVAIPMRIHERSAEGNSYWDASRAWYLWSRSGAQLFDINDGSTGVGVSLSHAGELVSAVYSGGEERYYYQQNPRTIIAGEAVHYVSEGKVWSALWNQPNEVVGPQ